MGTKASQWRGAFFLMLAALIWGTAFVAQSVGMDYIGPCTFNAVRSYIGGLVLLPLIFWNRRLQAGKPQEADPARGRKLLLGGGALCGLLNGFVHAKLHISAIITTLSSAYIFRGIQCVLLEFNAVSLPASMMSLENQTLKIIVMVGVLLICGVVYNHYRFGKFSKAIGSRPEAAAQSGARVDRMRIAAFVVAGVCAGIAGFFFLVRAASVSANTGSSFEFNVLLALLIGGMPISGGSGTKYRAVVLGSLIMAVLSNGMTLWRLSATDQQLIRGVIFLVAVTSSFDRKNLAVIK